MIALLPVMVCVIWHEAMRYKRFCWSQQIQGHLDVRVLLVKYSTVRPTSYPATDSIGRRLLSRKAPPLP